MTDVLYQCYGVKDNA